MNFLFIQINNKLYKIIIIKTGAYIVDHPLVDKISFTGSSEVG